MAQWKKWKSLCNALSLKVGSLMVESLGKTLLFIEHTQNKQDGAPIMMLSSNNRTVKERWKPMRPIRKFTRRLKRLFKWTPVIWKDEDWDYVYFLKLTQFKLEQMAELHVKDGDAMNSKLYASEMLHASHLLLQAIEGEDTPSLDTDDIENQKRIDEAFKYISKNLTKWWD